MRRDYGAGMAALLERFSLAAAIVTLLGGVCLGGVTCSCGHYDWLNAAVLVPCVLALWVTSLTGRFYVRATLALLPLLLLKKAITDTLWDGHEPIWPRTPPPEWLLVDPRLAIGLTLVGAFLASALALRAARLQRAGVPLGARALLGAPPQRAGGPASTGFDGSAPHSNHPGS